MRRSTTLLLSLATMLLLATLPATAQNPAATSELYLPLVIKPPASSSNLTVTSATYLGGIGADKANAVDIASDNTVVIGGAFPGYAPAGVTAVTLPGATDGAVVRLAADGQTVRSVTRIGANVADLEIDTQDHIIVCGDFGIAALSSDGASAIWSAVPGAASRCAVGADGTAAVLVGTKVYVYDAAGTSLGNWDTGAGTANDLAVASAQHLVIATGFVQITGNLQTPYIRAWGYNGTFAWKSYDFPAGTPNLGGADTRGERIAIGRDGKLYFAASIAGGTGSSVLARDPKDTSKEAGTRVVVGDKYTNPYNCCGNGKIAWFGRFNPVDGALEQAQSLLVRNTSDDKGNSISIKAITADANGNVFIAGDSACCLKDRSMLQVNGTTVGNYELGEGYLLSVSPDFKTRLAWTAFAAPGTSAGGSPAQAVAVRGDLAALTVTFNPTTGKQRGLITANALQAAPGSLAASDGYVVIWPGR